MATSISQCYYNIPKTFAQLQTLNKTHVANPSLKIPKFSRKIKNSPLKGICNQGSLEEAFVSFSALFTDHGNSLLINPNEVYAPILELCAAKRALLQGQQIHAHLIKFNVVPEFVFLSAKLVSMYGKCGSILDADKVFDKMHERTIFTWNAMMGANVSNGEPLRALELFREMRVLGVPFDSFTFPCVLKACGVVEDIHRGAEIHGLIIKCGYDSIVFVANSLVSMYAKCNDILGARKLFDRMNERNDVVSWNSIISAYSLNGQCMEALGLFREMQKAGVGANTYTLVAALQACEDSSFKKLGMEIHAAILRSNQVLDVYVANALVAMHVRFGKMSYAARVFDKLDEKDNITWNSMIAGFTQNGLYNEALQFFCGLQDANLKPDEVSLISILAASGRLGYLLNGKEIHAYAMKNWLDSNIRIGNTLIDMYSKCCCVAYAGLVFDKMLNKDLISWTTVIAAYVQNNCHTEALKLLREVQTKGMDVDTMMIGSTLLACSGLRCLSHAKEVHGYTLKQGLYDLMMQNMIIDVYADCGNINYATRMFELIKCKDVVSWTSMISCYVHNGLANEALGVFYLMKETSVEPDSITLVSILSAAASLSALNKGKEIHGFIFRKGFMLEGSTVNSLVDMYACCGSLENAYKVFISTRSKSLVLWTTMINAYGMHGRGKAAVELFSIMEDQKLIPDHITFLALLCACSHSGLINEGKRLLETMKCKYQLEPWPEHYACLVDLLGRANHLEEAYHFVKSMQIEPTAEVWCAFLGACRIHSNKKLGEIAAQKLLELDPESPGSYVLISNVFAASGRWKDVEEVRMRMKGGGLKKNPGCSWIEVGNKVHTFLARDKSHPESYKIYQKLAQITEKLEKEGGYVPQTKFVLHNVGKEEKVQMLYGHSERLAIAHGLMSTSEGTPIRITKNLRVCVDCHTFCKLVSKFFERELIVRDASRFHHFEDGVCSCGDFW
ncbi:PREDICTED: pentatricopeptide repeat-containing protein At3g63370 [Populus euphratica]|uniref:Pentatricopeptide repeat-containing protein At3g63370 n=1 Tax=Populus euphratica TaxID=75702 RepID=A0AAJ6UNK4_POPEU|nr:PREDICTED: pentatricopeptide repeat-containing protein At3g63370 [Populus euphratica]XP_011032629.1 PREDICTED: pentatricopeptide repeat-containing protein At3g63370 [Populus euphratica]XP_011032630.1 PREDICTED: pentatricopeptide repeat-containing protein At3g63370 [Populus euphratica]XP_011032631.1 PREDICTED: pentatricopeptide repeat-containing protein At3g63370 [Populus euphratica]